MKQKRVDREAYNNYYAGKMGEYESLENPTEYLAEFESLKLTPFYAGGETKGYVRGQTVSMLLNSVEQSGSSPSDVTVLEAACGQGELSVYLASKGFQVIGIDISERACENAEKLAVNVGVENRCSFLAENLESLSVSDNSIDYIIGHAALHHFIKYDGVPREFARIMSNSAIGYFADGFGENLAFHLFHRKEFMRVHGDVSLTEKMVRNYFAEFDVKIIPADWFTMLDKLYLRLGAGRFERFIRRLSKVHFALDRKVPANSRITTFLTGSIITIIRKK